MDSPTAGVSHGASRQTTVHAISTNKPVDAENRGRFRVAATYLADFKALQGWGDRSLQIENPNHL